MMYYKYNADETFHDDYKIQFFTKTFTGKIALTNLMEFLGRSNKKMHCVMTIFLFFFSRLVDVVDIKMSSWLYCQKMFAFLYAGYKM